MLNAVKGKYDFFLCTLLCYAMEQYYGFSRAMKISTCLM